MAFCQGRTFHRFPVDSKTHRKWVKWCLWCCCAAIKCLHCACPTKPHFGITIATCVKKVNYVTLHLPWKLEFGAKNDVLLVLHYGFRYFSAAALRSYASCHEPNLDWQIATSSGWNEYLSSKCTTVGHILWVLCMIEIWRQQYRNLTSSWHYL